MDKFKLKMMSCLQSGGSVGSIVVVAIVVGPGVVVGAFVVVGGAVVVVGLALGGWKLQSKSTLRNSTSSTATNPVPFPFLVATN